ncbi:ATP-binding protein [Nesterenkonia halotolerans]|uniref:ATP-binding protein n=1 Tax=Nesterenkonia halotolerans TaxID=225325 RepID=UPI003EE535EB
MTLELTLPSGQASLTDHAQWRIETLQLLNWGGFHGRTEVQFSSGSTLLSGASGTGKSTILDAYIALMMPSDTSFNGASNEASGRARSAEQRNLLTYLRGKMDTSRVSGSDEMRDQVLRGIDGAPTWGALAATFVNGKGRRYTVLRIYFVKAGASVNADVTTTFAAYEGALDLTRLEPLAAGRFDKRAMKADIPGLTTFNTFRDFEANIHARLHIGGPNSGRQAMRLLARVQAGMEVKKVDGLYKSMVLEEPITYRVADDALEHFADLEASYAKMIDEANKEKALRRLPELQRELAEAETRGLLVRKLGVDEEGPSPLKLWQHRTHRRLLDEAVEENSRDRAENSTLFKHAKDAESEYQTRLNQTARDKASNGGGAIDERRGEIMRLQNAREVAYRANIRFQQWTETIDLVVPETDAQFLEAQIAAEDFLEGFDQREAALKAEEDAGQDELSPLKTRHMELQDEKASLRGRASGVPRNLHDARVRMAQTAGLDPMKDLPFAAELIDVRPEEEHWRKAIETTLGGMARTVLVDRRTREKLSAAIDGVTIRPRIRFHAVDLAEHEDWRGRPDHISGKLQFKNSPYSRWVQDRVSNNDHLCVPDPASLAGSGPRVTPAGQTRDGDRGAHGESGHENIIGFSNERRLADIETLLDELDPKIAEVRLRIQALAKRLADLREQRTAHIHVQDAEWAEIDHLGIERRAEEVEHEIRRLRDANEILDGLEAEEKRIKPLHEQAYRERTRIALKMEELEKQWGDLVRDQDLVQDAADAIVERQTATVTDTQHKYLDDLFAENWGTANLNTFSSNIKALRNRLREEIRRARQNGYRVDFDRDIDSIFMDELTYQLYEQFGTNLDQNSRPLEAGTPRLVEKLRENEHRMYLRVLDAQESGPRRIEQERIPLDRALEAVEHIRKRSRKSVRS